MVQTEHACEKVAIGAGQEWRKRAVADRDRNLLRREESFLVALSAPDFQRFVVLSEDGPYAHAVVFVAEVVWRVARNSEEQVLDGRQRRGLAGLVGSEQDVNVRTVDRQFERDVRESGRSAAGRAG